MTHPSTSVILSSGNSLGQTHNASGKHDVCELVYTFQTVDE